METHRLVGITAAILATSVAQADLFMSSGVNKRHYQVGSQKLTFDSGEFNVLVRDGITVLAPCVYDPVIFYIPPVLGCPLGTTGFISAGDVDRDGVRDDNSYWSVQSVVPAFFIEPSRPELAQLYAGPPSKLPRPLSNFRDDSAVTFYNISEPATFRAYDQSRYELIRRYGPVRQVETAIAVGTVQTPESGDVDGDGEITPPEVEPPAVGAIRVTVTMEGIVLPPIFVPVVGPEIDGTIGGDNTEGDGSETWAAKVRIALANTPAVSDVYGVEGTGNAIVLTERNPNGNDATLNIRLEAAPADPLAVPPRPATTLNAVPSPTSTNSTLGVISTGNSVESLQRMNEELVVGQYLFTFPRLGNPEGIPVTLPVNISPNLEAVNPAARNSRLGFRFTSGLWDGEYYQMDPRTATRVTWTGNDRSVVRPGDTFRLSILNEAEDFLTFPPTVPQSPILLSPTVQQYQIPPFFYDVGEEGVFRLTYNRFLGTSGASFDTSQRDFRAKIRMVDSYPAYASITLPVGTSRRELAPASDYDRDGMTNIEEFAYQFPTFEAVSAAAREQFTPFPTGITFFGIFDVDTLQNAIQLFSNVEFDVDDPIIDPASQPLGPAAPALDAEGHVVFSVNARPNTGTTLKYTLAALQPGKTKPKPIRLAGAWEVTRSTQTVPFDVIVKVDLVGDVTGEEFANDQPHRNTGPPLYTPLPEQTDTVQVEREVLTFRTLAPWPVGTPLPDLRVLITSVPLR